MMEGEVKGEMDQAEEVKEAGELREGGGNRGEEGRGKGSLAQARAQMRI